MMPDERDAEYSKKISEYMVKSEAMRRLKSKAICMSRSIEWNLSDIIIGSEAININDNTNKLVNDLKSIRDNARSISMHATQLADFADDELRDIGLEIYKTIAEKSNDILDKMP